MAGRRKTRRKPTPGVRPGRQPQTHLDVVYQIEDPAGRSGNESEFKSFADAAAHAVLLSEETGETVVIEVVAFSEEGAYEVYGTEGLTRYEREAGRSRVRGEMAVLKTLEISVDDGDD